MNETGDKGTDENFLKNLRVIPCYESVTERYFKHVIHRCEEQDFLVLSHSNRIEIVTLAPSHDILKLNKKIKSIDFNASKHVNRLENQVQGKGKKGGQKVNANSMLCSLICEDGTTYRIPACIKGKIIEINKRLVDEPTLINKKPFTEGYIAIMLPPFQEK